MQLQLPEPSPDALHASRSLQTLIANDIRHKSGWISFARYMELALYAPGLGYYSGGAAKLGKDGDFTTAPEITPLFGATLARAVAELLPATAPQLLEFGAGTGKLALDLLTELTAMGVAIHRYSIVEVSSELRARQQQLLKAYPQVVWLDQFPAMFAGVVIGNEVLDAMPAHIVVKTEHGWRERGIGLSARNFVFRDRLCDPAMIEQIPEADALPVGYLTEVHPVAAGFMRSLSDMLRNGLAESGQGSAAFLIDYGFPAREYYLDQRDHGTLMCHYRHHAHGDPFFLPGLQDITTHVDFTAMARAAIDGGLDLLGYLSQAAFLLEAGLGDLLLRTPADDARQYLPQANAVQKLTSPAEMGELFKVLVVGTKLRLPERFERNDRSHRL
ncbi:SAM-dependent MidA family methyltransferase [Actimicrobium sp. GrIS 1.19]|uniref:class I SAM-dependent methyltransferase n=1 Tax=Actimicrobium sp. GrIS 1.19 TaxID=3071708 RepID=UPI002E04F846|nr:SAM-dependent MidA family methyltransferase [Actimicrobium sp. GrIS 1.19]